MPPVAFLLLAAGASRRMEGRDKLLEPVEGVALLALQARRATATGAPLLVTLPPEAPGRAAALAGSGARIVPVADAAEGMAASLRAGVAALPAGTPGVLVALADMPELTAKDHAALLTAAGRHPESVLRATTAAGAPGHPVLFPRRLFGALSRLEGDTGARALLAAEGAAVRRVPLPGERARTDLDTPAEWARWRAATGR